MSGRKAVEIKRFGLTQVYVPEDESKTIAIVVFVHGLFGHPQRTWTGCKQPERRTASSPSQVFNLPGRLEQSTEGGRLSVSTDPEAEPGVTNESSSREILHQGSDIPLSSMINCSQIFGLQEGEVFWPESLLPIVLPETRILTWGYDADVDAFNISVGHNNVEQHSTDLLTDIANLLDKIGDQAKPIIFVVHSLGGIVVKEALNIASHSEIERHKRVASATCGITFLGTPHRGSGSATIGKHAYRIARLATKRPNIKLLRSLEKNSDTLKGISNRFRSTQQKWDIKISSFYEDREVRKYFLFHSLIVDSESAQIGHPGEEVSSIPKNHREMTKFMSLEEVGFERVSSQLCRWVNDIKAKSQIKDRSPELEECLSSLENAQTGIRLSNVASSYDGTFQWLFDGDVVSFADWLEEDQSAVGPSRPIFWINGKPGSGKSTLMKFAMRDSRTLKLLRKTFHPDAADSQTELDWILLGFFFHDRGSHVQKSIDGMLQGVLHQLLYQLPDLLPFVYNIYKNLVETQRNSKPEWTFDTLCAAWKGITQQRTVHLYACMFLDALDEHEGDNNRLSKFIYELLSSADGTIVRIKICVASRNWNIFGEHFGSCPQFAIHEHTTSDIQVYTSERLYEAMASFGEEGRHAFLPKVERLASQVTTKARGVFIWVRIVLDELVKGVRDGTPLSLLEEKVMQMPEELSDLYRHTLKRIEPEYAEESFIMLEIAFCSLSPLPLRTFMNCVSVSRWHKVHEASEAEMIRQLISRSGGLLEINDGGSEDGVLDVADNCSIGTRTHVQFIHQTVKDFVAENRNDLGLFLDPSFKAESGYLYLLESGTSFGATWARKLSSFIFEYAYLAETEGSTDVVRLFKAFSPMLNSSIYPPPWKPIGFELWIHNEHPQYFDIVGYKTPIDQMLVLTAAAGLKELVTYQIAHRTFREEEPVQRQSEMDGESIGFTSAALLTMVATGKRLSTSSVSRESMINLVLKHGVGVDQATKAIAASDQNMLLDALDFTFSRTALAWVLRHEPQEHISNEERYSIARLLLENRANPNALAVPDTCCPNGTSLLQSCIRHYDVEAVRLLLLHEVDAAYLDEPMESFASHFAEALRGETTISKLLLEYGIDTKWHASEKMGLVTRLVGQSLSLTVIGSSEVGGKIGAYLNLIRRQRIFGHHPP